MTNHTEASFQPEDSLNHWCATERIFNTKVFIE